MDKGEKEMEKSKLLIEAIADVMKDDPDCQCERCDTRRDWCRRAQEEVDKDETDKDETIVDPIVVSDSVDSGGAQ